MRPYERIPAVPYLTGRCQRFSNVGTHSLVARIRGRLRFGLGLRSGLSRLAGRTPARSVPDGALGAPSRFAEGAWVRVIDEGRLRATLDSRSKLRGLEWADHQWFSCERTFRVAKVVRRIIDDGGETRLVSRTVLLDGVDCGGEHGHSGCGRHCPMMYRDEWLEPASAPSVSPQREGTKPLADGPPVFARVRPIDEIERSLDPLGRRDGLMFMPEMAGYAGRRLRVSREITKVQEFETWVAVPSPVYVLEHARCTGGVLASDGPCDRQCHLLWHRDWLIFD